MLVKSVAERKSMSAEDTIRLLLRLVRRSRVVCGVLCRHLETSLCATVKQVKTFRRCALFGVSGEASTYVQSFVGAACLHAYIVGCFALLL